MENEGSSSKEQQLRQRKVRVKVNTEVKIEGNEVPTLGEHMGLADFVTLANAMCGTGTIFFCLNYLENAHYEKYLLYAFMLTPLGVLFDFLDGWIARNRYSSPFGGDMDSLADLVSFGIAPACLGFTLGLRGIWDSAIMIVFVLCGLCRLARYNVTADILSDAETGKVKYYEGVPIPSSLLLVFLLFIAWRCDAIGNDRIWGGKMYIYPGHFHPFSLLYLILGICFVCRFKIPKP